MKLDMACTRRAHRLHGCSLDKRPVAAKTYSYTNVDTTKVMSRAQMSHEMHYQMAMALVLEKHATAMGNTKVPGRKVGEGRGRKRAMME